MNGRAVRVGGFSFDRSSLGFAAESRAAFGADSGSKFDSSGMPNFESYVLMPSPTLVGCDSVSERETMVDLSGLPSIANHTFLDHADPSHLSKMLKTFPG